MYLSHFNYGLLQIYLIGEIQLCLNETLIKKEINGKN